MTALVQVIHPGDHVWTLKRRFVPWQRVVQPVNIASGEYRPYRAVRTDTRRTPSEWRQERREQRRTAREDKLDPRRVSGWRWLYLGPLLLVAILVIGAVGQVVEAVVVGAQILVWLVLMPFALLEVLAQWLCGLVLRALRLTGAVRSRVDVVCRVPGDRIVSLTVLAVPGFATAGHLARALTDHLWKVQRPFDPQRDPVAVALLNHAGTQVVRHDSVWTGPSSPTVLTR
ncbi:hypothetical protein [Amycolatopsis thermophila]|uniref:RDD family protein n=1 Tax=Amycolatopsis thermophila TaxID=206084 RepID=A0ABU0EQR8_9PSEU|nr:hypothetical protein [Amycolatopsis thermophila]MDQ0377423.1 hypothetical protein [Amycolatopsis thermophila]